MKDLTILTVVGMILLKLYIVGRTPESSQSGPVSIGTTSSELRAALITYALSMQGTSYIPGGSDSYRSGQTSEGGDCSATMQHIFAKVAGINIGTDTWDQWNRLQPIDPEQVRPGDLWYGKGYLTPDGRPEEHTGLIADLDRDGRPDLIHNGADKNQVHVTYDFLETDLGDHTKGYRRAVP